MTDNSNTKGAACLTKRNVMTTEPNTTTSGSQPTPSSKTPGITDTAHRVHELFCKRFYQIPFELFAEDWELAAQVIASLSTTPEFFIDAIYATQTLDWLDPVDLHGDDVADSYRRHAHEMSATAIFGYINGRQVVATVMRNNDIKGEKDGLRQTPFTAIYSVYHIVRALEILPNNEAAKIIADRGEEALQELNNYPALRKHISGTSRIPIEDIIGVIEVVLAASKKVEAT